MCNVRTREDMRVTVIMHARCCQWLNVDYWVILIKIWCMLRMLHIFGLYMCCHKGPWWRLLGLPHAITICVACPGVTSPCHVLPFSQVARLGRTVPTLQPEKTWSLITVVLVLRIHLLSIFVLTCHWIFLVSSPTLFQLVICFLKWYVAELVVTVVYDGMNYDELYRYVSSQSWWITWHRMSNWCVAIWQVKVCNSVTLCYC